MGRSEFISVISRRVRHRYDEPALWQRSLSLGPRGVEGIGSGKMPSRSSKSFGDMFAEMRNPSRRDDIADEFREHCFERINHLDVHSHDLCHLLSF